MLIFYEDLLLSATATQFSPQNGKNRINLSQHDAMLLMEALDRPAVSHPKLEKGVLLFLMDLKISVMRNKLFLVPPL